MRKGCCESKLRIRHINITLHSSYISSSGHLLFIQVELLVFAQIFVSLLFAELPGIGMCRPTVRDVGYLGTGKHRGGLHRPGTLIQEPNANTHYRKASSDMWRDTSHTRIETQTLTQRFTFHPTQWRVAQIKQQQRIGPCRRGRGGGMGGGPLVDLCAVYLHWKPRRCEIPTQRRCANTEVICRGGFNSLQRNDWPFLLSSLQEPEDSFCLFC